MRASSLVVALLCTLCLMLGCQARRERSILPSDVELLPGDVVLRRGSGLTSRAVIAADKGGTYSHIGIAVDSAGVLMICHAVPGEPDFEGDQDRVKLDHLERFFGEVNAERACILRCHDTTAAQAASQVAMAVYKRGTLFDHDYNASDTTRMYCCELIEYAYSRVGLSLVGHERHSYSLPPLSFEALILPSDFLRTPHLEMLVAF